MAEYIEHIDDDGIIERVDAGRGTVTVRVAADGECGACPAARLCSVASSEDRRVEVAVKNPAVYRPGEEVTLRGSERMHRKAVMLATVLPCIALVAVMTIIYLLTGNQFAAALGGAGSTILFFLVLWLMRNHIAREFVFEIVRSEKGSRDK